MFAAIFSFSTPCLKEVINDEPRNLYYKVIFMVFPLAPPPRPGVPGSASSPPAQEPQAAPSSTIAPMSAYQGRTVKSVDLPGVSGADHFLSLLPPNPGQPLDRDQVRESIRILFATGRFADVQAEVTPSGPDVLLSFATSPHLLVGGAGVGAA